MAAVNMKTSVGRRMGFNAFRYTPRTRRLQR